MAKTATSAPGGGKEKPDIKIFKPNVPLKGFSLSNKYLFAPAGAVSEKDLKEVKKHLISELEPLHMDIATTGDPYSVHFEDGNIVVSVYKRFGTKKEVVSIMEKLGYRLEEV